MLISRSLVIICFSCFINGSFSKPSAMYLTEGRGLGSTLWEWITYPFTWWSSEEPLPANDQLVGFTTYGPFDNIEIAKRNVTVWCNDHTCTTMRCDKFGCKNVTCNIYDTKMNGECREYNSITTVTTVKPTDASASTELPKSTEAPPAASTSTSDQVVEERPLELEAVLSSTVTEASSSVKKDNASSPQNKI